MSQCLAISNRLHQHYFSSNMRRSGCTHAARFGEWPIEEHRHFARKESRLIWTLLIGPNLFYSVKCVLEAAARHFRWMFSTAFQYEDTTNVKPLSRMRKSLSIHWHLLFENSSVFSKFLFGDGYLMGHNSFRFVFIILPTL